MNADFGSDGLLATTLKHYIPRLEDQIFTSKPLLWVLREAGCITSQEGGEQIVQPLIYGQNPNVGSYEGPDTFGTDPMTGISAAQFPWKQFYGLLSVEGIELAKNQGKPALLKLLEARVQQLELTMSESLEEMLFSDGSGNTGKDFCGLGAIVDASNPSWGNLGGIDRTTYAYWRANETDVGANNLAITQMATMYNTCSEGNDHPTNIFATQNGFEAYEALLTDQVRYEDIKMGDQGFQSLMYKGAPIAFSANVTAQEMLFLNMKYLKLYKLSGVWFKPTDMQRPVNADVFYKALLCYGNLVPSNCKRHGKLTGIDNG